MYRDIMSLKQVLTVANGRRARQTTIIHMPSLPTVGDEGIIYKH